MCSGIPSYSNRGPGGHRGAPQIEAPAIFFFSANSLRCFRTSLLKKAVLFIKRGERLCGDKAKGDKGIEKKTVREDPENKRRDKEKQIERGKLVCSGAVKQDALLSSNTRGLQETPTTKYSQRGENHTKKASQSITVIMLDRPCYVNPATQICRAL